MQTPPATTATAATLEAAAPSLIELMPQVAPPELHQQLWAVFMGAGWRYGSQTDPQAPGQPFWNMDLTDCAPVDALWQLMRTACEQRVGHGLRVARQYANGHTFGQGGQPHTDDARVGCYTLLYYPMLQWQISWEGDTVFYSPEASVLHTVQPRPNCAVLFDSRIIHVGRAPSRGCPHLRVSVAFKLEQG